MTDIQLDETHDPTRRSWVESANLPDADFPVQNLPYCVFWGKNDGGTQIGLAIGDRILSVSGIALWLDRRIAEASDFLLTPSLAPLMAQTPGMDRAAAFPHAQIELIGNAGHYPMEETPVWLNARLEYFMGEGC